LDLPESGLILQRLISPLSWIVKISASKNLT
jgi:hypothetical protein